jgi:hypothetical protein
MILSSQEREVLLLYTSSQLPWLSIRREDCLTSEMSVYGAASDPKVIPESGLQVLADTPQAPRTEVLA